MLGYLMANALVRRHVQAVREPCSYSVVQSQSGLEQVSGLGAMVAGRTTPEEKLYIRAAGSTRVRSR